MAQGKPRYQPKHRFRIRIGELEIARFRSMSELSGEVEVIEEHEGGDSDVADQQPGKRTHAEVTLAAGASENEDMWIWWNQVLDEETGEGLEDDAYKKDVLVEELGRDRTTVRRAWRLTKAWPRKFVAGDFDATASENQIRSVTLVFMRLKKAA